MSIIQTHRVPTRADILVEIDGLPSSALLTCRQSAAYLGTSTGVLANWRSMRRGPRYHGAGDFVRYRRADLDEWIAQRAGEVR